MPVILKHPDAQIRIDDISNDKRRIKVNISNKSIFAPIKSCETKYPVHLIRQILNVKGPAYLCDEILREEKPEYVQMYLEKSILSYVDKREFENKRILDFGCGSGASSVILSKMFPNTKIIGIELDKNFISIARSRAKFYDLSNLRLILSLSGAQLPKNIGKFDFVVLSAVYEHLLPEERINILPQIWSIINSDGILFINQTPYRFSPLENHTTGLPFINYLPDKIALIFAQRFSKRVKHSESWRTILRRGVRGGTEREIMRILRKTHHYKPVLLKPDRNGLKDRVDLWYEISNSRRPLKIKKLLKLSCKMINYVFGAAVVPVLSLAIKKQPKMKKTEGSPHTEVYGFASSVFKPLTSGSSVHLSA